jgi:protein required for attachment to host cells
MADTCIVVADGARARLFLAETPENGKGGLVEMADLVNPEYQARGKHVLPTARSTRNTSRQSGPVHPYAQRRGRHLLELEKRFAQEVVARAAGLVRGWNRGSVLLIADPRMLGLLREAGRTAFRRGVTIQEIAKDYSQLPVSELYAHLVQSGVIGQPAARR